VTIDDPFAEPDDGENARTVILPSPGGRRAAAEPRQSGEAAPTQSPTEVRRRDTVDVEGNDSASAGERTSGRKAARLFERSEDRQKNPLLGAAAPLLELAIQIRTRPAHFDVEELREKVAQEIKNFDRKIASSGLPVKALRGARYALCAAIDDVVLNTPQGSRSAWTQRGMVATFHHEVIGGDRLWEVLDQLKKEPANNLDLLELIYYCISLGFEGKYRVLPRGASELADVRQDLARLIRNNRGQIERGISPRWKPAPPAGRGLRDILPNWMIGLLAISALAVLYAVMSLSMSASSAKAVRALDALPPIDAPMVAAEEPAEEPPLPAAPSPTVEKFSVLLQKERDEGLVIVDEEPGRVRILLTHQNMFKSGSDRIDPSLSDLVQRIGEALNEEEGGILIVGHTDNVPIHTLLFPDNETLSRQRAGTVAALLGRFVEEPGRISYEGKGDRELIQDVSPDSPRNRRVEIFLLRE
jgi:type VI secretion system protein ImpK